MTGAYLRHRIPALHPSLATQRKAQIISYCGEPELDAEGLADRSFVVFAGWFRVFSVPGTITLTLGRSLAMARVSYQMARSRGLISCRRPTTFRSQVRRSLSPL